MRSELVAKLLEPGEIGDNAIDAVLAISGFGDVQSLRIIESSLEHYTKKKLTYFTPGSRVASGADVYSSRVYEELVNSLVIKAQNKTLLNNAAATQDEIIRTLNYIKADAGSLLIKIKKAGGLEAVKIFQLLDTHLKVQARLIHNVEFEPRKTIWETPKTKPWWRFW